MRMPTLFIGHGSPMNAIEDNAFTSNWKKIAESLPRPEVILSVSAHWFTEGTRVMDDPAPPTIYDMYGFPKALYEIVYDAPGAPEAAKTIMKQISHPCVMDHSWGLDHGTWSVLRVMYPERDIPVLQLSIDGRASAQTHFEIGKSLASLRDQGIMILGSGNVVHNLRRVRMTMEAGFDWAQEFDNYICQNVTQRRFDDVIHYSRAGSVAELAFPTHEHFDPLLYVIGASHEQDTLKVYNEVCTMGSISMTSYVFTE